MEGKPFGSNFDGPGPCSKPEARELLTCRDCHEIAILDSQCPGPILWIETNLEVTCLSVESGTECQLRDGALGTSVASYTGMLAVACALRCAELSRSAEIAAAAAMPLCVLRVDLSSPYQFGHSPQRVWPPLGRGQLDRGLPWPWPADHFRPSLV